MRFSEVYAECVYHVQELLERSTTRHRLPELYWRRAVSIRFKDLDRVQRFLSESATQANLPTMVRERSESLRMINQTPRTNIKKVQSTPFTYKYHWMMKEARVPLCSRKEIEECNATRESDSANLGDACLLIDLESKSEYVFATRPTSHTW